MSFENQKCAGKSHSLATETVCVCCHQITTIPKEIRVSSAFPTQPQKVDRSATICRIIRPIIRLIKRKVINIKQVVQGNH